jgi:hypothetical protein
MSKISRKFSPNSVHKWLKVWGLDSEFAASKEPLLQLRKKMLQLRKSCCNSEKIPAIKERLLQLRKKLLQ